MAENSERRISQGSTESRPTTRFARNAEQLARAFGLNLSPRKRKASIAIVNEWIAAPGFPKKTKHGWLLSDVKEFLSLRFKELGAESKGQEPRAKSLGTSNIQHPTSNIEGKIAAGETPGLPIDPNGGPSGELFPAAGDALKESLDLWEEKLKNPLKWAEAPIQKWQIDYLKQYRAHLFPGSLRTDTGAAVPAALRGAGSVSSGGETGENGGGLPTRRYEELGDCESQKALAVRLAKHFQGRVTIDISEQQISRWKNGEGLRTGDSLPPAKLGNRFDTAAWAEWIERVILPRYGVKTNAQGLLEPSVFDRANEAEAQMKIDRARAEAINLAVLEGKYIEVAAVERIAAGLARQYHELWKARNEKDDIEFMSGELRGLGVGAEIIERIREIMTERARDFLAGVESRCEKQAKQFQKMLTAENA